ncbi:MAG: M20/M25/M40 family metallo-hydrolase [Bacillota bacterium]
MRFIVKTIVFTFLMTIAVVLFPLLPVSQTSSFEELVIDEPPVEKAKPLSQQLAELNGRGAGSRWEQDSAAILVDYFQQLGLEPLPQYPDFLQKFKIGTVTHFMEDGRLRFRTIGTAINPSQNVLGYLPGRDPDGKWIILGAHYDGQGEVDNTIYPSANDNLSGVLALTALAKAMANEHHLNYTILFVAFGAEEVGLLGSDHLANNLPIAKEKIQAVINLDTIGKTSDTLHLYATEINPIISLLTPIFYDYGFKAETVIANGISDHYPFALKGIPSVTVATNNWKEGNHSPEDRLESLNLEQIGSIAGALKQSLCYMLR